VTNTIYLTLKMTSAQVVENVSHQQQFFQNYPHPDDHTVKLLILPGSNHLQCFIIIQNFYFICAYMYLPRHIASGSVDQQAIREILLVWLQNQVFNLL